MIRILWIALMLLSLTACGRKGPLVRPESLVPARPSNFTSMQRGEEVQLDWSIPKLMESGGKLADLAGFRLFRRESGQCPDCPDSWRLIRQLDLEYLQGGEQRGDRIFIRDSSAVEGISYDYRLIPYTRSSLEGTPATARFTKRAPIPPPQLQAASSHGSILLQWTSAPLPEGYRAKGYAIYRNRKGEPIPFTPLATTETFTFEDKMVEQGVSYSYLVAQMAEIGGQIHEGIPATLSATLSEPD